MELRFSSERVGAGNEEGGMMSEWQKCPVCNGVGVVSGGYFTRAGDFPYWNSDHTTEICKVCVGRGLIVKPDTMTQEHI